METTRRSWMKGALGLSLAPAGAAMAVTKPYARVGNDLKVGVAAYSFRNQFAFMKGKPNKNLVEGTEAMSMPGFIEWCGKHGVEGAELTSYFFPPEVTNEVLGECRRVAHVNGVAVTGTAVGNNFSYPKEAPERAEQMAYVKEWIDHASVMGAPHVRVFAGKHPKGISSEEAEKNAIDALAEAADYAGAKGIFLGIENHDSITTADRLLRIVKAVESPWVGVNLDSGNFIAEDVYAEMAASVPYAVNVQIKTEIKVGEKGKEKKPADLERVMNILKDGGYAGHVILEYEESHDPFENVPRVLDELRSHVS